jgi:two-component system, chemotaxis family, protein-glutamate methylesterase/glutaminase
MADRRLVVVGASAGGVEALRRIFAALPQTFAGPICIVLHVPAHAPSVLPAILTRAGKLLTRHARDGDRLLPGGVLIGPPDHHLIVQDGCVRLWKGPQENRQRPAVDQLFRSAAAVYGASVVGVVLSGALDDGAAGLGAIKTAGGLAIVQAPADAAVPDMPRNALEYVAVDYALPAPEIAALLVRLVGTVPLAGDEAQPVLSALEAPADQPSPPDPAQGHQPELAPVTCPDCHGNLWEFMDGALMRYQCRTGHSYSRQSLFAAHDESVERALWAGLRALEENAVLARRLGQEAQDRGHVHSARHYRQRLVRTEESIRVLKQVLEGDRTATAETVDEDVAATEAAG